MISDSLNLENYVTVTQNNSTIFSPTDIVNICKRKNNKKRDFLFVNSLQGKHLNVDPNKSFSMFNELCSVIKKKINGSEKIIVIGFAETATAISHYIAATLPNCIYYMQTTREAVNNGNVLLEFKEEHSHATEQLLYGKVTELSNCDRIIFIDDEISTGNTVLNFIHEIEKLNIHVKYSVASILNWQDDEWTNTFKHLGIDCFYLLRGKIKDLHAKVTIKKCPSKNLFAKTSVHPTITVINNSLSNFTAERIGGKPISLSFFERNIYTGIAPYITNLLPKHDESVLVLGTEEYMYTPMVFAKMLNYELGVNVKFHATTRSPIETSLDDNYAIHSCYSITSCYDKNRNTFIYNLRTYDKVFIVTDVIPSKDFVKDIYSALISVGCNEENISIIVLKG